jgi:flagellar biosynthesis/type III secretory pathway protein FliH
VSEAQLVRENIPNIYPYGNSNTKINVIGDDEIEEGCCVVETKSGMIDARFDTQLQILMKAFRTTI